VGLDVTAGKDKFTCKTGLIKKDLELTGVSRGRGEIGTHPPVDF